MLRVPILHGATRILCALPPSLQAALAGGPVVRAGLTLEPELILLCAAAVRTAPAEMLPPARTRAAQNRMAIAVGGRARHGQRVTDLVVDGAAGPLRARHYAAAEPNAPLVVYFHGGGFAYGDVDTHDAPCRLLSRVGGFHLLSVEYRLAPEHPFPAAVDDALAALHFAQDRAHSLGADPTRVAVAGDSAGANLAAVCALAAPRPPYAQLLFYPPVDRHTPWPSLDHFADGFLLTRAAVEFFHASYVGADRIETTAGDLRLHPLRTPDLSNRAPALVVTAGFDPLRDEGEAYAQALERAGNRVTFRRYERLVHGFINMIGVSPACRRALIEIAESARTLLARRP